MTDDADKKSANADKDDGHAMVVTGVQLSNRAANSTSWKKGENPTKGRTVGSLNKDYSHHEGRGG